MKIIMILFIVDLEMLLKREMCYNIKKFWRLFKLKNRNERFYVQREKDVFKRILNNT